VTPVIDPGWLVVLALASYRLTRIPARDSITDRVRDALANWANDRPTSLGRAALDTLVGCTYCVGWWISGATLATYLLATGQWDDAPVLVHGIEWAAVAGAQALLSAVDDTLVDTSALARAETTVLEAPPSAQTSPTPLEPAELGSAEEPIVLPPPGPEAHLTISYSRRFASEDDPAPYAGTEPGASST